MKALQLDAPKSFRLIDHPEPVPPGAGEVLVRTHRVGVCGTDVSAYLGKMPFFGYPRIPGHELGVEVLEVGAGVTNVRPGDRCSVEPYMNCGRCLACRKGATNCCAELKVIGVMMDGGLCERFVVRADKLHASERLSFDQLALVETLAIGRHAVQRAGCSASDHVLVIGAGPIGLAASEFVRIAGAHLILLDVNQRRLEFCRSHFREVDVLSPGDDFEQKLRDLTGGNLPDVILDATGNKTSMSRAFTLLAPTGRLVFVGITTEEVSFRHPPFHKLEGTLLCSRNALPGDFTAIIQLIETGRIDTQPWITHRSTLATLGDDFPAYLQPDTGVVKAVVEVP